jgi:hypothetical protein
MVSRLHILASTATVSVLLASFVLTGCHSPSKLSAPTLAFGKVAAAYQESPYKTDIFEAILQTSAPPVLCLPAPTPCLTQKPAPPHRPASGQSAHYSDKCKTLKSPEEVDHLPFHLGTRCQTSNS